MTLSPQRQVCSGGYIHLNVCLLPRPHLSQKLEMLCGVVARSDFSDGPSYGRLQHLPVQEEIHVDLAVQSVQPISGQVLVLVEGQLVLGAEVVEPGLLDVGLHTRAHAQHLKTCFAVVPSATAMSIHAGALLAYSVSHRLLPRLQHDALCANTWAEMRSTRMMQLRYRCGVDRLA